MSIQEWDKYRLVKIEHGELVDQIKNKNQKDWIKVCEKLGVIVGVEYGDGSHAAAYKDNCPPENRECCVVTLHRNLHAGIQRDIFKKILCYGLQSKKYNENDMWEALGVKIK